MLLQQQQIESQRTQEQHTHSQRHVQQQRLQQAADREEDDAYHFVQEQADPNFYPPQHHQHPEQPSYPSQQHQQPYNRPYNILVDDPNPNNYNPHQPYLKPRLHDPRSLLVGQPFPVAAPPPNQYQSSPPRGRNPVTQPFSSPGRSGSPPSVSPPRRLFSHAHDSPEEWERFVEKKRQQESNKAILEEQIRERRERQANEARERGELDYAEQRKYEMQTQASPSATVLGSGKKKNLSHLNSSVFGDLDAPEAGRQQQQQQQQWQQQQQQQQQQQDLSVVASPTRSQKSQSSYPSPPRVQPGGSSPTLSPTHSTSSLSPSKMMMSEEGARELESLRQVAVSQARELLVVKARLTGLEEGRHLFETMAAETKPKTKQQSPTKHQPPQYSQSPLSSFSPSSSSSSSSSAGILGQSPLRQSFGRSPPFRASLQPGAEEDDRLPSDSALIPADPVSASDGGAAAAFGGYAVATAGMMMSNFGLTSFDKTFNPGKFEGRKSDALEQLLTDFQNRG